MPGMKLGIFGLNMKVAIAPDDTARWHAAARSSATRAGGPASTSSCRRRGCRRRRWSRRTTASTRSSTWPSSRRRPTRLVLGTGIIIVPQRNPLVLAKQVASLDRLSGGRFQLGIGVGYLEPELNAIGVTLAERASRTDDALGAMRAIWYDPAPVSFHGAHTSSTGSTPTRARSAPCRSSSAATRPSTYRRAVEQGHGWYGFFQSPEQTAEALAALAAAASSSTGRPSSASWRSASPRTARSPPSRSRPTPPPASTA